MKHVLLALCIPFCAINTISAMDLTPVYQTPEQMRKQSAHDDDLYKKFLPFNQAVENEYKHNSLSRFASLFSPTAALIEKDAFSFMNSFVSTFPVAAHRTKLLNFLSQQDLFFCKVINHFIDLARKNLDNVTCDTLATIQNAHAQQPTVELNGLPLDIKEYVMNAAYDQIKHPYTIILTGHTAAIRSADINANPHLAATAGKDGTFRLWDLDTGKQLYIFPEKAYCGAVKFDDPGKQLATATAACQNTQDTQDIHIKIWDTRTKNMLHTIQLKEYISAMAFFQKQPHITDDTILGIFKGSNLSIYQLEKNKEPQLVLSTESAPSSKFSFTHVGNYETITADETTFCLHVTKNSRPLYVCERAIDNTHDTKTFSRIKQLPLYKSLTLGEQEKVNVTIISKITQK